MTIQIKYFGRSNGSVDVLVTLDDDYCTDDDFCYIVEVITA